MVSKLWKYIGFQFSFPFLAHLACRIDVSDVRRCLGKDVCNNGLVNWGR